MIFIFVPKIYLLLNNNIKWEIVWVMMRSKDLTHTSMKISYFNKNRKFINL